ELGIGGADVRLPRAELASDDVRALRERGGLVHRDRPRHALTAEAAVGREHELVVVDVLERGADVGSDLLRRLDLQAAVADHPDGDFLRQVSLVRLERRQQAVPVLLRLAAAGCKVIQIEEPAIHSSAAYGAPAEVLDFLVELFNHTVEGLGTREVSITPASPAAPPLRTN